MSSASRVVAQAGRLLARLAAQQPQATQQLRALSHAAGNSYNNSTASAEHTASTACMPLSGNSHEEGAGASQQGFPTLPGSNTLQHQRPQWVGASLLQHPHASLLQSPLGWRSMSSAAGGDSPSSSSGGAGSGGAGEGGSGGKGSQLRMSLAEALSRLVDAAVESVEKGDTRAAIALLKEGIATFEPNFPDSPELGELHNQVALLELAEGDPQTAATHAEKALALSSKHFGERSALTGHRLLRLGVAKFGLGQLTEAAGQLHRALGILQGAKDASQHEAQLYLDLCLLAGATDAGAVASLTDRLLGSVREMKAIFGAESMIMSLALAQHDRLVHQPLAATDPEPQLCEALLKQHAKLLEEVNPEGEDLAVLHYKLATFYYVNDILGDAQGAVRKAADKLRALYPEDHDLVALCRHRMGMICAATGDHRAAAQLLAESAQRYGAASGSSSGGAQGGGLSGLAREAAVGQALAKYRGLPPTSPKAAREAALQEVRTRIDELASAIGVNHMLARGAMRHFARVQAMAKHG